jgi:hypothetical protein
MPDFQFTFVVVGISPQKATAIRDRIAGRLQEDEEVVLTASFTRTTSSYRVIGVDTATSEIFDERVEAADRAAAEGAVVGSSSTRVVATVQS